MYKLLLISKYLRRKLAPLFAAVAVTICTAMVIIVSSVMGGFLGLMQTTAKQLTPDVVIQSPSQNGFEGYEDLIRRLEALDEVELATAGIETPATVTIGRDTQFVFIRGIDPAEFDKVVPYFKSLMWSSSDLLGETWARFDADDRPMLEAMFDLQKAGRELKTPPGFERFGVPEGSPAAVIGVLVNPAQRRDKDGSYLYQWSITNPVLIQQLDMNPIRIALPVFSPSGEVIDAAQLEIAAVNEFNSGFYDIDKSVVYVPMDWLQKSLQMNEMVEFKEGTFNPETGEDGEEVVRSARATHIYVKAAIDESTGEPYDADFVSLRCQATIERFLTDRGDFTSLRVQTWEQVHGVLLGAVKNEKGLVTFLFAIISIVAIVMVATTFYMIVLEKTRDIGVLRAIGAPATGVLGLFLVYGLAIGVIGAGLGVWLAWFTVTNLNHLQDALATRLVTLIGTVALALLLALGVAVVVAVVRRRRDFGLAAGVVVFLSSFVVLIAAAYYAFPFISLPWLSGFDADFGWRMWDPQLYLFDKIPDEVDWFEVLWIGIGAVLSSVLGAIIPAVIAARLNPVEALRYE